MVQFHHQRLHHLLGLDHSSVERIVRAKANLVQAPLELGYLAERGPQAVVNLVGLIGGEVPTIIRAP